MRALNYGEHYYLCHECKKILILLAVARERRGVSTDFLHCGKKMEELSASWFYCPKCNHLDHCSLYRVYQANTGPFPLITARYTTEGCVVCLFESLEQAFHKDEDLQ